MDFGGNMFCLNNREQNVNSTTNSNSHTHTHSFAWDSWETTTSNNTSTFINNAFHPTNTNTNTNALMFLPQASTTTQNDSVLSQHHHHHHHHHKASPYGGDGSHVHPDPHLTCLKLGKRHYFEDAGGGAAPHGGGTSGLGDKRGKGYCVGGVKTASFPVPRCQVEGCHVALLNAKDYHKRHKVCEMHSKAPKVVVLGMEQRFCQQCSRFHVVSEFDDSKRSCRRRLAGHNERRRKSSHDSVGRNSSQAGCAHSLLSSGSDSWLSPSDLSVRCSAALRELIAENRAAHMARQLVSDRDWHLHHHAVEDFKEVQHESNYFPQQMFP